MSSPAWDSARSVHTISRTTTPWNVKGERGQSCTFRRTLSQSNFRTPLARNEHSHHKMCKWRWSQKNGLIVPQDKLVRETEHDKGEDPLKWENKGLGNSIFVKTPQIEAKKLPIAIKSELLDGSPSLSMVEENYSSLEVGANGMVLICTERGCRPAHPFETEYATHGKDSNRIGSEQGSSGADLHRTDVYYQKMLELNPGNPFVLATYAMFLQEVQHDVEKAGKYYKMALMTSPEDGEILSMYAKFIWDTHNDAAQAEVYFRKAVEIAFEDCHVVASYAHFLWNSTQDEEEESGPSLTSSGSETTAA